VRSDVLFFAVPDLAAVLKLFRTARRAPFTIAAFEFFTDRCLARLVRHRKVNSPFDSPSSHYVLLETEAGEPAALEAFIAQAFDEGIVTDGTLAQSMAQAAQLWTLREGISESLSSTGTPHKNDIALPVAGLEAFCAEMESGFTREYPDWEICLFGHIGDGNLHVNVMKPDALPIEEFRSRTQAADRDLFALVQKHHGSISAEHGIGLLKKPYLSYSRAPAELALLRTIKHALDPQGILNPGKIFD
jgi:FAD/FMN-containing dehydrogenase